MTAKWFTSQKIQKMFDTITALFSKDTSEINGAQTAAILISLVATIVVFVLIARLCFRMEKISCKPAHSLVKIIMVAAAPLIFVLLSTFDVSLPIALFIVLTIVMCIAVAVWNIITYGILGGLLFSLVHIVTGLIAGISIAALVFFAIVGVVVYFFAGTLSVGNSSSSAPEFVRNPDTGETVPVERGANGELYIMGTSNVLRSSDYSGRYFDDNGNQYISG